MTEYPQPYGPRVAVVDLPTEASSGGLWLPDSVGGTVDVGIVVAVGRQLPSWMRGEEEDDRGLVIERGDRVWYHRHATTTLLHRDGNQVERVHMVDRAGVIALEGIGR